MKVGDLIWFIWGWPGPDWSPGVISKVDIDNDSLEYYDLDRKDFGEVHISNKGTNFIGDWGELPIEKLNGYKEWTENYLSYKK